MVNRGVLIGIIAAVIVAGSVTGYVFFQRSSQSLTELPVDNDEPSQGVFANALTYTSQPISIDQQKGYSVFEIADGTYWVVGSGYQTMFLTTGQGVIAVDAPQPMGD